MDSYKLTYGGNTLTYLDWNGYVKYDQQYYKTRYEYNLFGTTTSVGKKTGSVTMPFSAFDSIGIRTVWNYNTEINGNGMFTWYDNAMFTATTGYIYLPLNYSNTSNYYVYQTRFLYNNASNTFETIDDTSTAYRGMTTTVTSNAKWSSYKNSYRTEMVGQIIGVKYQ